MELTHRREENTTANSTFAIGGVSFSADGLVVAESFVLRIKFSGKNPAHRKSAKRWWQWYWQLLTRQGSIILQRMDSKANDSQTHLPTPKFKFCPSHARTLQIPTSK